MKILAKTGGAANSQKMTNFSKGKWSGSDQLWWVGKEIGAKLDLELPVAQNGNYDLELVLTKARDYGIVQIMLDGKRLGGPIDLFNTPDVITTGVLSFEKNQLKKGNHKLSLEIVGSNPKAVKSYMVGLDYVQLKQSQTGNNIIY